MHGFDEMSWTKICSEIWNLARPQKCCKEFVLISGFSNQSISVSFWGCYWASETKPIKSSSPNYKHASNEFLKVLDSSPLSSCKERKFNLRYLTACSALHNSPADNWEKNQFFLWLAHRIFNVLIEANEGMLWNLTPSHFVWSLSLIFLFVVDLLAALSRALESTKLGFSGSNHSSYSNSPCGKCHVMANSSLSLHAFFVRTVPPSPQQTQDTLVQQ